MLNNSLHVLCVSLLLFEEMSTEYGKRRKNVRQGNASISFFFSWLPHIAPFSFGFFTSIYSLFRKVERDLEREKFATRLMRFLSVKCAETFHGGLRLFFPSFSLMVELYIRENSMVLENFHGARMDGGMKKKTKSHPPLTLITSVRFSWN